MKSINQAPINKGSKKINKIKLKNNINRRIYLKLREKININQYIHGNKKGIVGLTLGISCKWVDRVYIVAEEAEKIEKVIIGFCHLKQIPNYVNTMSNLKILNLMENNISLMPNEITRLINLETLNLSNNQINLIPNHIFTLKSLKTLDLSYNKIDKIEIGNIMNCTLVNININNNDIKELPKNIFNINSLKYLNVGFNKISKIDIPDSLVNSGLVNIQMLDNLLGGIPLKINLLYNLEYINFNNNKISYIPKIVLLNLRELYLCNNLVTALSINLNKLQRIFLNNNIGMDNIYLRKEEGNYRLSIKYKENSLGNEVTLLEKLGPRYINKIKNRNDIIDFKSENLLNIFFVEDNDEYKYIEKTHNNIKHLLIEKNEQSTGSVPIKFNFSEKNCKKKL